MSEEILINFTPQETRVALISQGEVQELLIERAQNRGYVGNIYLGKVVRVLPGMQSAFIDIGLDKSAFIHIADIHGNHEQPIEKVVFDGQTILVQVLKDPLGTKGARLTTNISIAGRNLVYLPNDEKDGQIGISQKITEEENRETLKNRVKTILPGSFKGSVIVRTSAEEASDEDLREDLNYLVRSWEKIHSNTCLLYTSPSPRD